jgi:hypothetical protein
MANKEIIIQAFVTNFVLKDKRERSYLELTNPKKRNKFTDRLNHQWHTVLNTQYLTRVDKSLDDAASIKKLLTLKDGDVCYVISNYSGFDDRLIEFTNVFSQIYARGLATILINTSADILFLDTEQVQGAAHRFIGRAGT